MRKLLLAAAVVAGSAAAASAADMRVPYKAPLLAPIPIANWTGFYVGVHAGAAWGYFRSNAFNIGPVNSDGGFTAGGQIGYNWQMGRWVLGVEGDLSAIDIGASTPLIGSFNEDWTGTIRARFGYAIEDYLAYLTGGVAFTKTEAAVFGGGSASKTVAGGTIGFGIEKMFTPNWTGRIEALYVNVPTQTYTVLGGPVIAGSHNYALRAGVNYIFH